jgi:flagellar motor switch protein FliN
MIENQVEHPMSLDSLSNTTMNPSEIDLATEASNPNKNLTTPELETVLQGGGFEDTIGDQNPSGALLQIPISVQVILGSTKMTLSRVMALGPGSLISLDQRLSEPVLLLVNGDEFARGTIVVIDDASGQLGVTLTDIAPSSTSSKKMANR